MVLRDPRRAGRGRVRRTLRGLAAALIALGAFSAHTALGADPARAAAPAQELAGYLQRFRAEGAAQWKADHVLWLYGEVLAAWGAGALDVGEPLEAVVGELRAFRAQHGFDAAPFVQQDVYWGNAVARAGRIGEARAFLEGAIAAHPEDLPDHAHLVVWLASLARYCREHDRAGDLLERVERALDVLPDDPVRAEAEVLWRLERTSYASSVGLQDEGARELAAAREILDAWGDELGPRGTELRSDLLLEELNLANVLDDPARAERLLSAAEAEPWYADLPPAHRAAHRVRRATAAVDRERLDPSSEKRAARLLEELLAEPDLPPDERLLCLLSAAEALVAEGELARARERLAEARTRIAAAAPACGPDLPTRREIDLVTLEAELALAGDAGADLDAALANATRAFDVMVGRWMDAPLHDGGLSLTQTQDRLRVAGALIELALAAEGAAAGAERAFAVACRVQAAGSLARTLAAPPPGLDDVRRALVPEGGGLLVYLPGARHTYALLIERDALEVVLLAPPHRWDAARQELLVALAGALRAGETAESLDRELAALGEALLPEPLARRVAGWRALSVVGLDGIGYLPFELLRVGGERLGRRLPVAYLPSLALGVALHERAASRPARERRTLRVVAAPDAPGAEAAGVRRLAFGAEERARLLGGAGVHPGVHGGNGGSDVEVLAGAQATPDALLASAEGTWGLHVVAHTVASGRADRPRALLLHPNAQGRDRLAPGDAERGACPPFVVLTSCGAGQGPLRRGDDGRHHLGGAFFLAGADVLVLSYLDVEYGAALALSGALHDGMRGGASPAAALVEARRRSDGDALMPYLVHAHGLAHEPVSDPARAPESPPAAGRSNAQRVAGIAGIAAAGLALTAWLATRRRARGTA